MPEIPAILYAAKSTVDKAGSIPTQLDDCRGLVEHTGGRFVCGETFFDENASAYKGSRGPGLEQAMRAAEAAAAEHGEAELWVQHSDRLARGDGTRAAHLIEYVLWARKAGIALRSVQDDATFGDLIHAVLMGERNYEDSARKSQATSAGKRRRFEKGDSAGPLPFGYRLVDAKDAEGNLLRVRDRILRRREPDPEEAPVVLSLFRMLDEGRGIGEITRWVNGRGVRTKRGNAFGRSRVREILRNPWYGGKVRSYGELRDGNHEPLLAWEEFERIAAKLDRKDPVSTNKRKGGRPSTVALLSGVLVCAHCGHGIWHRRSGDRRHYVCGNVRHATGVCDAAAFDAARVEEAVVAYLDTLFVDFERWLENVSSQRATQRDGLVRELAALEVRRAALERDEKLVRKDYMRQLRAGNQRAAELATGELDRIAGEQAEIGTTVSGLESRLEEWDEPAPADAMLDWWNGFSAAIKGDVIDAASVREANTALRERFAAIYVNSQRGGTVRLDFVLKEREPDAPLVSSRLWADDQVPDDATLIDFIHTGPEPEYLRPVKLAGSRWCRSSP